MPVFYFDTEINAGGLARDQDGIELATRDDAKREAVSALYCLAKDIEADIAPRNVTLHVRDQSGRVIFETALDLTFKER